MLSPSYSHPSTFLCCAEAPSARVKARALSAGPPVPLFFRHSSLLARVCWLYPICMPTAPYHLIQSQTRGPASLSYFFRRYTVPWNTPFSPPHQEQSSYASQELLVCFSPPTFLPLRHLHTTDRATFHPSPSLGQTQLSLPNRPSAHLPQDSQAPN